MTGFNEFEFGFESGIEHCPSIKNYINSLFKYQYEYLSNRRTYDLINLHMSTNYKTMDAIIDDIKKAVDVASIDSEGFNNIGK